ncbi:hypothetical protein [Soonwooa sp.]|uniref:hypothetical protein n=1 Tax=Soonwooa sp. TaxID=1938592 RepID=UPI0028B1C7C2|nr:hypothetical protein [Soonwooa sp.]
MKSLLFLSLFILIMSCSSTAQNMEIKSISVSTYGGEMGYVDSIKVTKDSIFTATNVATDSLRNRSSKILNSKIKISDLMNDSDFQKVISLKDGKSNMPVDGTDTALKIETAEKVYTIINADNSIWKRIVKDMYSIQR